MTPPTTIRVLEDHIMRGEAENCEKCPIALALLDQLTGPVEFIEVSEAEITVHLPGGDYYTADAPAEAASFISLFDHGQDVRPFEFAVAWSFRDWDGALGEFS